jgi:hypothetical protein
MKVNKLQIIVTIRCGFFGHVRYKNPFPHT